MYIYLSQKGLLILKVFIFFQICTLIFPYCLVLKQLKNLNYKNTFMSNLLLESIDVFFCNFSNYLKLITIHKIIKKKF